MEDLNKYKKLIIKNLNGNYSAVDPMIVDLRMLVGADLILGIKEDFEVVIVKNRHGSLEIGKSTPQD